VNPKELLRGLPYFAGISDEDLDDLCRSSAVVDVPKGTVIIEEGQPAEALFVVADGRFLATQQRADRVIILGDAGPGEPLGELSVLQGLEASATVKAVEDSQVISVSRESVERITSSPEAVKAILGIVVARLREREVSVVHADKMAALGTNAAGLAHEFNNPAAAVKRTAQELGEVVARLTEDVGGGQGPLGAPSTALERSSREEGVGTYLEEMAVSDPWELAPALVAAGWDQPTLASQASGPDAITRMALALDARRLTDEMATAGNRISELVNAVKRFVYLDQAPVQDVDVNQGIKEALLLLKHKTAGMDVSTNLSPDLPHIEAKGSELNQVWMNLIDNAIDAAGPGGRVEVRSRPADESITVEVENTGPAIPPEVLPRLFETFFTTKEPGRGTGLGLATTDKVVTEHSGRIEVESVPDSTVFRVTLPLTLPKE
jgi:signal transduction histidine kinase